MIDRAQEFINDMTVNDGIAAIKRAITESEILRGHKVINDQAKTVTINLNCILYVKDDKIQMMLDTYTADDKEYNYEYSIFFIRGDLFNKINDVRGDRAIAKKIILDTITGLMPDKNITDIFAVTPASWDDIDNYLTENGITTKITVFYD